MRRMPLAPGSGQAFDPIDRLGTWYDNPVMVDIDTIQSWNLENRYDLLWQTAPVIDGYGLQAIPSTYQSFGNNGSVPLHGSVDDPQQHGACRIGQSSRRVARAGPCLLGSQTGSSGVSNRHTDCCPSILVGAYATFSPSPEPSSAVRYVTRAVCSAVRGKIRAAERDRPRATFCQARPACPVRGQRRSCPWHRLIL